MDYLGAQIAPLGMGCWPIGGAMYEGAQSLGYTGTDDAESIRTIHAALDGGITLFDTAAAYGAGHSERLLARALKDRPDALIVTKIGFGIDEARRQVSSGEFTASMVEDAVDGCLRRLDRDRIDVMLLHINELPVQDAEPVFDALEKLTQVGKLRSYGWSTDDTDRATAFADRSNFSTVEYTMNLFEDAPDMQRLTKDKNLLSLIRSPLAMGLLSGKYDQATVLPADDVRSSGVEWLTYFQHGKVNPAFSQKLDAVRDLLTTDGRTLVQGALGWLWAKSETHVPVPGARSVAQIEGLAGALSKGALPQDVMDQITEVLTVSA